MPLVMTYAGVLNCTKAKINCAMSSTAKNTPPTTAVWQKCVLVQSVVRGQFRYKYANIVMSDLIIFMCHTEKPNLKIIRLESYFSPYLVLCD